MPEIRVSPGGHYTAQLILLVGALLLAQAGIGQVLRVANPGNPASLDPHKITGVWENRIVGDMFMGLTTEAPDGGVVPGAAESWSVSDDGLTWEFVLRSHTWSDGKPVTAADFVYSFHRMLSPETLCLYADFFFVIEGAQDYARGVGPADAIAVRALDDQRLQIVLRRPVAYFPGLLTHFSAMPVPRQAVEKWGDDWTEPANLVANGAFILSQRIPNDRVRLTRNPRFYAADAVQLEEVVYYSQENREAALRRYQAGQLDVLRDFPVGKVSWLRDKFGSAVRTEPYLGLTYVAVNHRLSPLADARLRAALSLALDRQLIAELVLGSGEQPAYSLVPPGTRNYGAPAQLAYASWSGERRQARARELLAQLGVSRDKPLRLQLRLRLSENDRRVALALQSMWREVGVQIELQRSETAIHYAAIQAGEFDLGLASWLAVYDDPQTFTLLAQSTTGGNNLGRYQNDAFDQLTLAAALAVDLDVRASRLQEAESLALAEHALLPLFHHASRNIVDPAVTGWQSNRLDVHRSRYLGLN